MSKDNAYNSYDDGRENDSAHLAAFNVNKVAVFGEGLVEGGVLLEVVVGVVVGGDGGGDVLGAKGRRVAASSSRSHY